jgi:Leucine-rich repeat (LRR) protein
MESHAHTLWEMTKACPKADAGAVHNAETQLVAPPPAVARTEKRAKKTPSTHIPRQSLVVMPQVQWLQLQAAAHLLSCTSNATPDVFSHLGRLAKADTALTTPAVEAPECTDAQSAAILQPLYDAKAILIKERQRLLHNTGRKALILAMTPWCEHELQRGNADAPRVARSIIDAYCKGSTELRLNALDIQNLPPEIGRLTMLKYLYVTRCSLTELPAEIGQLTNLRALYLFENELHRLPHEIGELTALEVLDLGNNELYRLPPQMSNLKGLQILRLRGNQIFHLPAIFLQNFKSLKSVVYSCDEDDSSGPSTPTSSHQTTPEPQLTTWHQSSR